MRVPSDRPRLQLPGILAELGLLSPGTQLQITRPRPPITILVNRYSLHLLGLNSYWLRLNIQWLSDVCLPQHYLTPILPLQLNIALEGVDLVDRDGQGFDAFARAGSAHWNLELK